jgi:hypothetical protein
MPCRCGDDRYPGHGKRVDSRVTARVAGFLLAVIDANSGDTSRLPRTRRLLRRWSRQWRRPVEVIVKYSRLRCSTLFTLVVCVLVLTAVAFVSAGVACRVAESLPAMIGCVVLAGIHRPIARLGSPIAVAVHVHRGETAARTGTGWVTGGPARGSAR